MDDCFKEFAEAKELNRHMKRDHIERGDQEEPDGANKFKCHKCNKSYKTRGWLIRHLNKDHRVDMNTEEENQIQLTTSATNEGSNTTEADTPQDIPTTNPRLATEPPTISMVVEQTINPEDTHLTFRITDSTARGEFKCPFRGCAKSTNTAKGMLNHGTTVHDWSFVTGKPKRSRRLKRSDPVGGLSGGS